MFQVGDKIFYPLHGAGIVKGIEEREILGKKEFYYILTMALRNLQVMIPVGKTSKLEIREVVQMDVLEHAMAMFQGGEPTQTGSYQQMQRIHMDKLMRGDIYEGVEVIRDLMVINKKRKLGVEGKTMLDNARQMLMSELVLVKGLSQDEAAQLLYIPTTSK